MESEEKRSQEILTKADVNFDTRVKDLSEAEVARIREEIASYQVEGDLRREVQMNIKKDLETLTATEV